MGFSTGSDTPSVIEANTDMIYTIRFQNTGNFPADFVKIVDTLSTLLDVSSIKVIASSHNYTMSLKKKNILTFTFDPINLPDSTRSERESHGFIKFSVKPKRTLSKNEVIKNTGYIYFDYNPAVITNTVLTNNQVVSKDVNIISIITYPNPSSSSISFRLNEFTGLDATINVYDIEGRLILSKPNIKFDNTLNIEALNQGVYFVNITIKSKIYSGKIVKVL